MKPNFIYLTVAAVLAIGVGVLGGALDALSSEKKQEQVAATPSHGEEAKKEETGPGAAIEGPAADARARIRALPTTPRAGRST